MYSIIARNVKEGPLIAPGQTVLVAVSGGADSVSLLHSLRRLSQDMRFQIHVATLDHGIRGEAAQRDVQHVRELALRWNLPFTAGSADAPALAIREGIGLEEAARRARYVFLAEQALRLDADCVAVGHHAHDQVETILMRIIRGSGTKGLRGMRMSAPMPYPGLYPKSYHQKLILIRPLLNVTRDEIQAYCDANQLAYRHDSSNDDSGNVRNFIRHQILPPLLKRYAHLPKSIERLASAVAADQDYIEARFQSEVLPLVVQEEDSWRIARLDFLACHVAMRRRLLREAFRRLRGQDREMSADATLEVCAWVEGAQVGKVRELGGGIRLVVGYDSLHIARGDARRRYAEYRLIAPGTEIELRARAEISLGKLRIKRYEGVRTAAHATGIYIPLPIEAKALLRTRRQGERFQPKGMSGKSRRIKDWMIDRKIPQPIRDQIPLVSLDGKVIAICVGTVWHLAEMPRVTDEAGASAILVLE